MAANHKKCIDGYQINYTAVLLQGTACLSIVSMTSLLVHQNIENVMLKSIVIAFATYMSVVCMDMDMNVVTCVKSDQEIMGENSASSYESEL